MNAEQREELRMLRARAYGPASDIDGDPAALQRLDELEDLARRPPASGPPALPRPDASPVVSSVASAEPAEAPVPEPEPTTEPVPPAPRSAPVDGMRVRALWAASLVATAVIAVAVTAWLTPTIAVSHTTDVRYVGSVEADPSADWPVFMGERTDDAIVFEDYLGLTALTQGDFDPRGVRCMAVVLSEYALEEDSYVGPSFWGCGAGGFPVRVPVAIDENAPEQLVERFPVGSALEFVLDGDRMQVFSDAD